MGIVGTIIFYRHLEIQGSVGVSLNLSSEFPTQIIPLPFAFQICEHSGHTKFTLFFAHRLVNNVQLPVDLRILAISIHVSSRSTTFE